MRWKFNLEEFLEKNRETAQLVYGVFLIILIPSLIVYNTVFIISKYNRNIDVILQRQALTVGRIITTLMKSDLPWEYFVQAKLDALAANNSAIQELAVLQPDKDEFKIIASTRRDQVGKKVNSRYYQLAWLQPVGDGLATDSYVLAASEDKDLVKEDKNEERFWLVAMPMSDANETKQALLTIKLSSKIVDDLASATRNISILLLVGTIILVLFFLLVVIRLWDYAILYRRTKEIDKMKDEFISIASHELKAPVTGIRGYISMVLDGTMGEVNKQIKKSLSRVMESADRLAVLVDDLLNVSRIEQGRLNIKFKPTDINPIIKDVIEGLSVQAKEKNLSLIYRAPVHPLPLINIDQYRLREVLVNLINNAIKYTKKGEVVVLVEEKKEEKALEIKVKDTGIGMSAQEKERLFEKFYRVKNEKTRHIAGTGLGLWITKQLVELMGGTIAVDSIENVGTQITVRFPVVKITTD